MWRMRKSIRRYHRPCWICEGECIGAGQRQVKMATHDRWEGVDVGKSLLLDASFAKGGGTLRPTGSVQAFLWHCSPSCESSVGHQTAYPIPSSLQPPGAACCVG